MRIVVRCQDPRAARTAQEALARAGVEALAAPGDSVPLRSLPESEDIVVTPYETGASETLAQAARSDGRAPLAVIAGLSATAPPAAGLESSAWFDGAIALDAPPALLAAQLAACIRAGVAEEERVRRRATALALEAPLPATQEPRSLKALYIGAPSPLFLSLESMLGDHGGLVAAAFSSFTGFDHLHNESFDAVVLNGAQDAMTAISLCAALRRNASLYHLPTMVITAPDDDGTRKAAIDRGASAVVSVSAPSAPGMGWLFEAIRRERRRNAAEHELRALRDIMGDARTGLFRCSAFETHLARLAADHQASGRALGLAVLRVLPAHGAREPSEQVWSRGFNEIASLAARLIRDADCGATLGTEYIAVALPATELRGVRRSAERIASVAECTAFASGESGSGPVVFEQSVVELQPGESGAALLSRALRAFHFESASA
ncbi:MAG: hypothetical protein AB7P07_01845 [Hyphomonadaceae bacterium]